jgi:hypothetical protein
MRTTLGLSDVPENAPRQPEKLFDLRLILGMLPSDQIRRIMVEAKRRGRSDVVRALHDYLSRRGRGRPRRDTYADIDAWLIVWADELFRSGHAPSAWAAIDRVVEGAWAAWDDGKGNGRHFAEISIGNLVLQAPTGQTLSRGKVLGANPKSIKHRILTRLRPNKRFPIVIKRNGLTLRMRLHFSPAPGRAGPLLPGGDSVYSHLPIYKALSIRKSPRRTTLPEQEKYR